MSTPHRSTPPDSERRARARTPADGWHTALTSIAPNAIAVRGYALDEMMGRLSFAEAVYLLLMGELPTPSIGRMLNAILVSSIDHGVTPPSTLAARIVATSGAPLKDCAAAGILALGPHHGGDIESCMRFLDQGHRLVNARVRDIEIAKDREKAYASIDFIVMCGRYRNSAPCWQCTSDWASNSRRG